MSVENAIKIFVSWSGSMILFYPIIVHRVHVCMFFACFQFPVFQVEKPEEYIHWLLCLLQCYIYDFEQFISH
jgi:hypothetical protein